MPHADITPDRTLPAPSGSSHLKERRDAAGNYFAARFSKCGLYRYTLARKWDPASESIAFIGLNPSTATEADDDPTIRRCIDFAQRWGYGGLIMLNLFAFRSTDPDGMKSAAEPVGIENDYWIMAICQNAGATVAAWGVHGEHLNRDRVVVSQFRAKMIPLKCLGMTKDGLPRHPLYLNKRTELVAYSGR